MKNNPACQNVLNYIDANDVSKSEFMSISDEQMLNVMWPDTFGVKPLDNNTTPELVRRWIVHEFRRRKEAARRAELKSLVTGAGFTIAEVRALIADIED